ncbi:NAD(+)/NADH kinase [Woeseiaceae bacterium]|nr:NAD(+)/NADH kinase [Woeseiaceae bacterium]
MIFKKIGIVSRNHDTTTLETIALLNGYLEENGRSVFLTRENPLPTQNKVNEDKIAATVDLMIAVGGDGTILRAANLAQSQDIPLLGINRGKLGFLADTPPKEMLTDIAEVIDGNYTTEPRMMLEATISKSDGDSFVNLALNDVVIQRSDTGRMLDFNTSIADQFINSHSGDGLIIATPTGSTAYSLSCGGPIIEPTLDCYVMVPICPHTLGDRPLVLPAEKDIKIQLNQKIDRKAEITIDGRKICEITPQDTIIITKASKKTLLIHPPGYDYYDVLRSKLHWGQDNRMRVNKKTR